MMKVALSLMMLVLMVCFSGCGSKTVDLENELNPDEVQAALEPGHNNLRGGSVIIPRTGDKVRGRDLPATLIPVTANSSERMTRIFGNTEQGFLKSAGLAPKFSDRELFQRSGGRTVSPDADGTFEFSDVKDGEYFVVTTVAWKPENSYYGKETSMLMQKVRLSGGERKEITLTYTESAGAAK